MRRTLLIILLLLVALAIATALYLTYAPVTLDQPVAVTIEPGRSTGEIAAQLDREGLLRSRRLFVWWAKLRGIERHLKPGRYKFSGPTAIWDILDTLYQGRVVTFSMTIPEGWTVEKIAGQVAAELDADSAEVVDLTKEPDRLERWDIPLDHMEGYLLPETYTFLWGIEAADVIDHMAEANQEEFVEPVKQRMAELGWNRHEVLTLASMIEAETGSRDERARISAVFHNRLQRGMLMQCDPTVVYAMGGLLPGRPLLRKDLDFESPYNTYLHAGLPPGPICNPGKAAIRAALYPEETDELYFVADGRGGHIFSTTLREHNRARAKVKREQGGS